MLTASLSAAERRHLVQASAAVFLVAGVWIGLRILGEAARHPWGSREVVIDIGPAKSPTEVEVALVWPAPANPAPVKAAPEASPPSLEAMLPQPAPPPDVSWPSIVPLSIAPPAAMAPGVGTPAIIQPSTDTSAALVEPAPGAAAPAQPSQPPAALPIVPPSAPSAGIRPAAQSAAAPALASLGPAPQTARPSEAMLYPLSLPAWRRNARPFDINDPRPRIAVVLVGLGPLHGMTAAAIDELPAEITLSFDPNDRALPAWVGLAHALGHEVMLDLPPSQDAAPLAGGVQRLDWVADRASGYVGLAATGSASQAPLPGGWPTLIRATSQRGLLLLDATPGAGFRPIGSGAGLSVADVSIDDQADRVSIDAQLAVLEARARQAGFAIGVAKGYPVTIERLLAWSRSLPDKNLALAPMSAMADQQASR